MIWVTLLSAAAWAAPVDVYVHGIDGARAVEVISDAGSDWTSASCQDQGTGADAAVDGSWTCSGLQVDVDSGKIAVIADAVSFRPVTVDFSSQVVHVATKRRSLVLIDPDDVQPVPAAAPSGPGLILLAQLVMDADARVPVVVIRNDNGSAELFCRDDGRAFDQQSNDAKYMCYGWLPGPVADEDIETEAILRETMGSERSLGFVSHTAGSGLRFARLDAVGGSPPTVTPHVLSLRDPGPDQPTPPSMVHAEVAHPHPGPDQPTPPSMVHAEVAHPPSPVATAPTPAPPGEDGFSPTSAASSNELSSVVAVCSLVFGGLVGWRMRSVYRGTPPLPVQLEAVAGTVLHGPSIGEPAAVRSLVPASALAQLVSSWVQHRRVVVVATDPLPPAPGVLRLRSDDVHDLREAIRALEAQSDVPVAVVIHGRKTLRDHATPSPDPLIDLVQSLADRIPVAVVLKETESGPDGISLWDWSESDGWVRVA